MAEAAAKPSESSAAKTAFCCARLDGPRGRHLWIDGNGKITAFNGTLDKPRPNAFSLAHIEDCPGATPACKSVCYVHGLKAAAPKVYALYQHNSAEIREILKDKELAAAWAGAMATWILQNASGGFRWHVSGDVFSARYAEWIVRVCSLSIKVKHWIYTRSLDFVPTLWRASPIRGGNLTVNISADRDNVAAALALSKKIGARVCFMAGPGDAMPDLHRADVIFPEYALRGGTEAGQAWFAALPPEQRRIVCPVDFHGKSEQRRCGPCGKCM